MFFQEFTRAAASNFRLPITCSESEKEEGREVRPAALLVKYKYKK